MRALTGGFIAVAVLLVSGVMADNQKPVFPDSIGDCMEALRKRHDDIGNIGRLYTAWKDLDSVNRDKLRENVINTVGAALLFIGDTKAFDGFKKELADAAAFEKSVYENCKTCNGTARASITCSKCSGRGACFKCNGSGYLERGTILYKDYDLRDVKCEHCFGTGKCTQCNGNRRVVVKCPDCKGEKTFFSKDKALGKYKSSFNSLIQQRGSDYREKTLEELRAEYKAAIAADAKRNAEFKEKTGIDLVALMVKIPDKDYEIGKKEVTQALWEAVMGNSPSKFKGEDIPVENVSLKDRRNFIVKLNEMTGGRYRLPTRDELNSANLARSTGILSEADDILGEISANISSPSGRFRLAQSERSLKRRLAEAEAKERQRIAEEERRRAEAEDKERQRIAEETARAAKEAELAQIRAKREEREAQIRAKREEREAQIRAKREERDAQAIAKCEEAKAKNDNLRHLTHYSFGNLQLGDVIVEVNGGKTVPFNNSSFFNDIKFESGMGRRTYKTLYTGKELKHWDFKLVPDYMSVDNGNSLFVISPEPIWICGQKMNLVAEISPINGTITSVYYCQNKQQYPDKHFDSRFDSLRNELSAKYGENYSCRGSELSSLKELVWDYDGEMSIVLVSVKEPFCKYVHSKEEAYIIIESGQDIGKRFELARKGDALGLKELDDKWKEAGYLVGKDDRFNDSSVVVEYSSKRLKQIMSDEIKQYKELEKVKAQDLL